MITDDELLELPEEPDLAFVAFEQIVRQRLIAAVANDEYDDITERRLGYMCRTIVAAREFGIRDIASWDIPSASDDIVAKFLQFTSDVDGATTRIRIQHSTRDRKYSVGLESNAKQKIRHYIDKIRIVIDEAELPEEKRDSLYSALHRLELEVDRNRTRFDAFGGALITVCGAIGRGFEKLEPARRWLDSIAGILGEGKEQEGPYRKLAPPSDRKRLQAPRSLAAPRGFVDEDDDIPF